MPLPPWAFWPQMLSLLTQRINDCAGVTFPSPYLYVAHPVDVTGSLAVPAAILRLGVVAQPPLVLYPSAAGPRAGRVVAVL